MKQGANRQEVGVVTGEFIKRQQDTKIGSAAKLTFESSHLCRYRAKNPHKNPLKLTINNVRPPTFTNASLNCFTTTQARTKRSNEIPGDLCRTPYRGPGGGEPSSSHRIGPDMKNGLGPQP